MANAQEVIVTDAVRKIQEKCRDLYAGWRISTWVRHLQDVENIARQARLKLLPDEKSRRYSEIMAIAAAAQNYALHPRNTGAAGWYMIQLGEIVEELIAERVNS